jgi:hypothetical protein
VKEMDLLELLTSQLSQKGVVETLSKSVNAKPDQVKQLAELALPTLLQAMNKNAKTESGAKSLSKALDQHADDDVDDVKSFLNKVDMKDGAKILGHLLNNKEVAVESGLAKQTGLDMSQVSGLLTMLAPLLLGQLGQQKKQGGFDLSSLGSLLGGSSLKGNDMMNMVTGLLDSDGDGDVLDDVSKLLGGFLKK